MSARPFRLARAYFAMFAALLLASGCTKPPTADLQAEWREAASWSLLIAGLEEVAREDGETPTLPAQWEIEGEIVSQGPNSLRGVVARIHDPKQGLRYVALLRDGEMPDDGTAPPTLRAAPWADSGRVPARFLALYDTLAFQPIDGTPPRVLAHALQERIGTAPVTIAGHGTGAVLATYLSFDLARDATPNAVSARLFGSPAAGDAAFAAAYSRAAPEHRAYDNVRDAIPHIAHPFDPDAFAMLEHTTRLDPARVGVFVRDSPECNHLVIAYAAMLDFRRLSFEDWQARLSAGRHPRDCIGPSPAARIAE